MGGGGLEESSPPVWAAEARKGSRLSPICVTKGPLIPPKQRGLSPTLEAATGAVPRLGRELTHVLRYSD